MFSLVSNIVVLLLAKSANSHSSLSKFKFTLTILGGAGTDILLTILNLFSKVTLFEKSDNPISSSDIYHKCGCKAFLIVIAISLSSILYFPASFQNARSLKALLALMEPQTSFSHT